MVIGDEAVSAMYQFLDSQKQELDLGNGKRIFKYVLPQNFAGGRYVVINFLPFVYDNPINEGVINVNIHVPKLKNDEPDTKVLYTIQRKLLERCRCNVYLRGAEFEFYADSRPTKDNDDTYYINLKFKVIYNNLKN